MNWDPTELRRVVALAGPDDGAHILRHLRDDLATARADLTRAVQRQDAEGARLASHVLIALCGTAGARELHKLAEDLYNAVASGAQTLVHALMARLVAGLEWLETVLSAETAER